MRKQKAMPLGEILFQMMREEGLEMSYNEYRLIEAWPEVMGQGIASYTTDLKINNRVLYVNLRSSVIRAELMSGRKNLVHRLNEYVGAQVIENIVFH